MPQAKIIENLGESRYRVQILYDAAQYQVVLNRQQLVVARLDEQITEAEAAADEKRQALADLGDDLDSAEQLLAAAHVLESRFVALSVSPGEGAQAAFDAAFSAYASLLFSIRREVIEPQEKGYQGRIEQHQKDIEAARVTLAEANEAYQLARLEVDRLKAARKGQQIRLDAIKATETGPELTCWTSAWDDSMQEGEEIEVVLMPGEASGAVIHNTTLAANRLTPPIWQSPAQALLNYMMLPGWQKWVYPFGTGSVVGDPAEDGTLTISFDVQPSSAQSLITNRQTGVQSGIEVDAAEYFAEGDRILLEYRDDRPVVVGYYTEPKMKWACAFCSVSDYYEYISAPAIGKAIMDAAIAGELSVQWRRDHGSWVGMTIDEAFYYGDGDGTLTAWSYGDEYPGLFFDYYKDELSFCAMQAIAYSSAQFGVYQWQMINRSTGAVLMDVAFLIDSLLRKGVRGKSTPPIKRTGGGLPIEVLE